MVALCFAFGSQAANILSNPGFDGPPAGLNGWSAHTTEGWSYAPHSDVSLSSPESCWMQGLYGNGGAPLNPYISYVYQKVASAPGYTYTADAWLTQFVTGSTDGGDNGSCGLFGDNMAAYSTNSANTGYYEDGWVEVQFLSSSNTILADYKSFIVNPAYVHNLAASGAVFQNGSPGITNLNWFDCPVTNQYNPNTIVVNGDPDPANVYGATLSPGPTNSIPNGIMTAPPGTVYVQFSLNLCQTSYASGAPHWDNCTLNQLSGFAPAAINNLTPNGGTVFNRTSTNFTFNVVSGVGTSVPSNDVQVVENGVDVSKKLQFSGSNTNWTVTLPGLASNSLYAITINVDNSANLVSSTSTRFDTFDPNSFVVAAEDYDFNSGHFIQNPVPSTNAANSGVSTYFGTLGTDLIDFHLYGGGVPGGGQNLIPSYPNRNTNTAWQIPADPQLPNYLALGAPTSGVYNVTIAYNNAGNWFNYTRNPYPNGGYYQIYARMSYGNGPNGGSETLQLLTVPAGTTNQSSTNLGYFVINAAVPGWNDDWGTYFWVPLGSDASGLNPTVVNLPAGQQTLQIISGLGCNLSYMVFVPIPALGLPPVIKNLNPPILTPGQNVFVSTNRLTYSVSSLISTLATNNIQTWINGVSVPETFTGSGANWTVSVPITAPANLPSVTFAISAVDNNGLSNGVSGTFDTFSQTNLMIEAGDFDFNGGQWIDNPLETATLNGATNSYYYYPGNNPANGAVYGVDFTTTNVTAAETYLYRLESTGPGGNPPVGTETNLDFLRSKLINVGPSAVPPFEYVPGQPVPWTNTDFDVAWWPPGTWLNYTRTFPANTYVIYGRLANGGAYSNATMSLVTPNTPLGSFSDPDANGFQSWHWVPLMSNGTNVVVSLSGKQTLKVTAPPGNTTGSLNAHFYMFVPFSAVAPYSISATVSAGVVSIKIPTQSGHSYSVYYSTSLNPTAWTTLASNISGDGTVKTVTDSTTGGAQRFYKASAY
ncbi:MAG TPA: hypothetical protein VMJ12_02680 [Candidatus Acidoferrales bacterium]|nr:hypothetical protein [Candidatus Acidoferrales bacterium]